MTEIRPFTDAETVRVAKSIQAAIGKPVQPCIAIWRFHDAPVEYQARSENGGDEDWIAFIPDELEGEHIGWLEQGTSFGCCDVSEYPVPGGKIRIGSHA